MTKSWKTTLLGGAFAFMTILNAAQKPSWEAAIKDQTVQMGAAAAVLAVLAKDYNVSGS